MVRVTVSAAVLIASCVGASPREPPQDVPGAEPGPAGEAADEAVFHEHQSFASGGVQRTYHFLEAAGHQRRPRPLVVVLHGGGATIDSTIGRPRGASPLGRAWMTLGRREGFHVVIPQGHGKQWNDCRRDCEHCGDQDDVVFLVDLARDLSQRYGIDQTRVFVTGESNGGFMTQRLAIERSEVFAAYGPINALMPANSDCPAPAAPVSIAYHVGTEDEVVRYDGGLSRTARSGSVRSAADSVAVWTGLGRCETGTEARLPDRDPQDGSTITLPRWDCPRTGTEVLLYAADGGGHIPPSTTERVSKIWESLAGRQNHDIESAAELWRFFRAHARRE